MAATDFLEKAHNTYGRVLDCLTNRSGVDDVAMNRINLPSDYYDHYQQLLITTSRYRNHKPHTWGGFHGPWIENLWIEHFLGKPLTTFSGLIPIFVQWTDIHVNELSSPINKSMPAFRELQKELVRVLRKNVIYVMVTQDAVGLDGIVDKSLPNVLSISAGGYGHVPIPLIKGELPSMANSSRELPIQLAFYGSMHEGSTRHWILHDLEMQLKSASINLTYHKGTSAGTKQQWMELVSKTKFNLAPRGFGRTSYRLTEIIQMSRLPVYLYDDYEWLPYEGTELSVKEFGFVGKFRRLQELLVHLSNVTDEDLERRLKKVQMVRYYYTNEGLMAELEQFFVDPFGPRGGHLRCTRLPNSARGNQRRKRLQRGSGGNRKYKLKQTAQARW